jgi:hypothetical protein
VPPTSSSTRSGATASRIAPGCSPALLPGVDVRGGFFNDEGELESTGQIAVFPTLHPSGQQYRWVEAPWETSLADAPEWLLELVSRPAAPRTYEADGEKVPEGQRHAFLVHEAARLRGLGYDHTTIAGMLNVLYSEQCSQDPPITDEEITGIATWFADKTANEDIVDIGTGHLNEGAFGRFGDGADDGGGGPGWRYTGNALTLGRTSFQEVSLPFFDLSTKLVIPDKTWWWADRIPHPASILIHGDAKLGKTESTQRLLDCALREGSFLGDFTVGFKPKVIYLEEEGAGDMQAKLRAYGWSADRVVALSADDLYGLGWMPLMASVLNHADTNGFNLIVIDTLFTYFQLPSDQSMNGFTISQNLRALFSYAKKRGISVWCLHHDNADGTVYRKNEMKAQFDILLHHKYDASKDLDTWTFEGRYFGKPKPEPIHYRFDPTTGERQLTSLAEVKAMSTRSTSDSANEDRLATIQRVLVEAQPDGVTVKDVMAKGIFWDDKTITKWLDIATAIAGDNTSVSRQAATKGRLKHTKGQYQEPFRPLTFRARWSLSSV